MFEASVQAVADKFVNKRAVVALVGGARAEQEAWALANLGSDVHVLMVSEIEGGNKAEDQIFTHLHQVREHTLAGVVIFDPAYVNTHFTRPIYLFLTSLAQFMNCKPQVLVHHEYEIVT
jgi:hypothetical protein